MMGALAHQFLDAMAGNPGLVDAMGIEGGRPLDGFIAATQLYLAVIAAGYIIQAIGTLRAEEAEGRLEARLAGTRDKACDWRLPFLDTPPSGLLVPPA